MSSGHSRQSVAKAAFVFGGAVATASMLGLLGCASWMLDLLSHFRVQYLALITISVVTLALLRARRRALLLLPFAVVEAALVSPLFCECGALPAGDASGPELVIFQHNLFAGNPRLRDALRAIDESGADLVVLHEVTARIRGRLDDLLPAYEYATGETHESPFGIALLRRRDSPVELETALPVHLGADDLVDLVDVPIIWAHLEHAGRRLILYAFRSPPPVSPLLAARRDDMIAALADIVDGADVPIVVIGDFNAARWSAPMRSLLRAPSILDAERAGGWKPTWMTRSPLRIAVDHTLYSRELVLLERTIGPAYGSDHRSQRVRLAWREP